MGSQNDRAFAIPRSWFALAVSWLAFVAPVHATDAVADTKLMDMGPVDPYGSPTNGLGS